jgi:hypothetical protein
LTFAKSAKVPAGQSADAGEEKASVVDTHTAPSTEGEAGQEGEASITPQLGLIPGAKSAPGSHSGLTWEQLERMSKEELERYVSAPTQATPVGAEGA